MIRIAFYYTDKEDLSEILEYDFDILIDDERLLDQVLKYNKPVKITKHLQERYDLLLSFCNKKNSIKAIKKCVIQNKQDVEKAVEQCKGHNYKFSIVVPNYNNGDWIEKTIKSVLNQTYQNWEMYIIDDISTDNSIDVINQYQDDRITLIQNEIKLYNGGSRNVGILKAKKSNPDGYLLFIDSDDWLANDYVLERLERYITGEDLITLDYQYYMNGKICKAGKHSYRNKDELFMTIGAMCAVWCKCFRVDVAPLFEFNTLMEDRNYHYRLINRIQSYSNYGEVTHTWNKMNTKSVTSRKEQKYSSDLQGKIEWDNCAYRHIAGMLDLLNELSNPKYISFVKGKIQECKDNIDYNRFYQC